jgi:hypothetical protein
MKGDALGRVRYRVTTIGKTITHVYHSSDDEHAEWDARLISAAPELLAACIELLLHASLTEHMSAFAVKKACDAVKKATEEET